MSNPERRASTGAPSTADPASISREVPWGGVLSRVRASVRARRLVPTGLALGGTDLMYELLLSRDGGRLAKAVAAMEAVVGGTDQQPDLTRLARDHVKAMARGWELTWRPWELERVPISDPALVQKVQDEGRGLLVSYPHLGPPAAWVPLARMLRPLLTPVNDWAIEGPQPGYNGYQVEHRRRVYRDAGLELIHAAGSARALMRALKDKGSVLLAMDLPGPRETRFLGKPVEMADGTARLATMTQCMILPVALLPRGRRWGLEVGEPVDPRDYGSANELHEALALIHERFIMSAPAHLEDPLRPGGWATATRDGWRRG